MAITRMQHLIQENKKLKEQIAHKNEKFSEWIQENIDLELHNKELMEHNKKFYLEQEKLKEEIEELKDGENTALMIDKLNLEFEQEVSKNDVYKSMISGLEKVVQRQDVLIEELREDLRKARETAIHYWSGGDHGECYADEVIPEDIREAVEDQE